MSASENVLLERLFEERRHSLTEFFRRRLRTTADAADLAQEVYLRMLRLPATSHIDNPEAYLFTVASNLAKEYAALERRRGIRLRPEDCEGIHHMVQVPTFERDVDTGVRMQRLREVLSQLSPKCRAAVLLQYRHGLSYDEIAAKLGVSRHMVKKYLSQGLAHCRRRMSRLA